MKTTHIGATEFFATAQESGGLVLPIYCMEDLYEVQTMEARDEVGEILTCSVLPQDVLPPNEADSEVIERLQSTIVLLHARMLLKRDLPDGEPSPIKCTEATAEHLTRRVATKCEKYRRYLVGYALLPNAFVLSDWRALIKSADASDKEIFL